MNYFSIDEILKDETKLKVKFEHDLNNFGDIKKNTNVELPYFLIKFLIENKHCEITKDLISKEMKNDLKSCPAIVNLNSTCSYFYKFLKDFEDKKFLNWILTNRISNYSNLILKEHLDEDDVLLLDRSEKRIIIEGRESYLQYRKYYNQ